MRPDKLTQQPFTRSTSSTITTRMERGRLSHLLFVLTGTSWRAKDKITAKLRYNGGTIMVIDRISASDLLVISDAKYGIPAFGSVYAADQADGPTTTENESSGKFLTYMKNALMLPIGNVYLGVQDAELEITVETGTGGANLDRACHCHIYSIDNSNSSGHVLQWDTSYDLESNQRLVREVYLAARTNASLFPSESEQNTSTFTDFIGYKDILVQMDVDGMSYNVDLLGLGAITSLVGELQQPANNLVKIFEDNDNLPSNVWVKVTGDSRNDVYIIALRELMLPGLTVNSQHEALDVSQKKMEKMERENPAQAQAYIQSGLAVPSTTLQAVKEALPAPVTAAK